MFALNRAKSASSRAIQFAISSEEKTRGRGIFAPLARRRAARKSINSCFCSGGNASAAASISPSVLINVNYTSLSGDGKEDQDVPTSLQTCTKTFIAHCGALNAGKENRCRLDREPRYPRIRDRYFVNIAPLQLGKEVVDLHWMRLSDERVEKQKTRCFARTSRQRRSQSRNRSRIPRRDIAAREDRTFLFHVRATFLQHEDYRGRSEIRGGTRQSPRKKR